MAIRCCIGCVAPKRHPGCHSHCSDYIIDKAFYNVEREIKSKRIKTEANLVQQKIDGVIHAAKKRRQKGGK